MKIVETLLNFLKEILPTLFAYKAGRDSKEKDHLEDENEALKEYEDINSRKYDRASTYDSGVWGQDNK